MNELALFAGAGGGILGGHLLGWRTVCAVEWEPYPASVLVARQNDKILPPFPIWDDVQTFDGHPWRGIVDVVSGGFPCQDISAAGKGIGLNGARSGLWSEIARLVGELRPRYLIVENVSALLSRGLGRVLGDLAEIGYDAEWHCIPASAAGAPHIRDRIWIIAYPQHSDTDSAGPHRAPIYQYLSAELRNQQKRESGSVCEDVADATCDGWIEGIEDDSGRAAGNGPRAECGPSHGRETLADASGENVQRFGLSERIQQERIATSGLGWWRTEPDVGRVAHGVPARVDRLKGLGNAVVPQIPEMIGRAILASE